MSEARITELTPEQEALISVIRDEWIRIALDTSPTDKQKAEEAIHLAYTCLGLKLPQQILWFDNPLTAVNWMAANQYSLRQGSINSNIWRKLETTIIYFAIERRVEIIINRILFSGLHNIESLFHNILDTLWGALDPKILKENRNFIESNIYCDSNGSYQVHHLAFYACLQAIGVDCLNLTGMWEAAKYYSVWSNFKDISVLKGMWEAAKHCGFWWDLKDIAVATPKPSAITLDHEGRLHAEGKPAVAYEGFNIYAYHGVTLPEKYGQLHPSEWQPKWLLEEKNNAELRRVLIQGIGYTRICQELQAIELDSWREYILLGIEEDIDAEPIYLLKMTCPSTGYTHVLRVPPSVNSAREAICWVNWGIDPE